MAQEFDAIRHWFIVKTGVCEAVAAGEITTRYLTFPEGSTFGEIGEVLLFYLHVFALKKVTAVCY